MSSAGGIGGGGGNIKMAVQQSLAKTATNTSFGAGLRQGAQLPSTRSPTPVQGTPALTATLEDLIAAFLDIEDYSRRQSPALTSDLSRIRAQLQTLAARSG